MPLSPHEAATMLGVPHTADAAAIDAAVERQRGEYDQQIARAVTPEIATYWRNQRARLDEAREVLHRAIDARRQAAEAAAAEAYERAMAGEADGDPGTASEESPSHAAIRAEWERLHHAPGDQPGVEGIIDPLAEGMDLAPFYDFIRRPEILKVLHAARQDIEIFFLQGGVLPDPLFDTQVAAMVCGFGDAASYETLARRLARVEIDKSARFTDWSRRPLSKRQLEYALADVTHLRVVYEKLSAQLQKTGRTS